MGLLDRLRGKKTEEKPKKEQKKEVKETATDLEKICIDDKEAYEALYGNMFLDPRKVGVSMKESVERAKNFERRGDVLKARLWYEIAGGLAIYEGNVEKVKKYFGKCAELSPNKAYTILQIPERAVSKAQEYYRQHLRKE